MSSGSVTNCRCPSSACWARRTRKKKKRRRKEAVRRGMVQRSCAVAGFRSCDAGELAALLPVWLTGQPTRAARRGWRDNAPLSPHLSPPLSGRKEEKGEMVRGSS